MLSDSDLVFGKTLETRKREEMEGTGSSWCCLIRIWFLEKLSKLEDGGVQERQVANAV